MLTSVANCPRWRSGWVRRERGWRCWKRSLRRPKTEPCVTAIVTNAKLVESRKRCDRNAWRVQVITRSPNCPADAAGQPPSVVLPKWIRERRNPIKFRRKFNFPFDFGYPFFYSLYQRKVDVKIYFGCATKLFAGRLLCRLKWVKKISFFY